MNWKHYLAILAPYAAAAAVGIAGEMQHSQNALVVSIGLLLFSALSHANVLTHSQNAGDK